MLIFFCLHPSLYLLVSWAWWDWPLTWLTNHRPSVLWHCWLDRLTHKTVSEMTYNVLSGTLNSTIPYHTGFFIVLDSGGRLKVWEGRLECLWGIWGQQGLMFLRVLVLARRYKAALHSCRLTIASVYTIVLVGTWSRWCRRQNAALCSVWSQSPTPVQTSPSPSSNWREPQTILAGEEGHVLGSCFCCLSMKR